MVTKKIASRATGLKIKFKGEIDKYDVEQENIEIRCVIKNTNNLFGTDWMEQFMEVQSVHFAKKSKVLPKKQKVKTKLFRGIFWCN